ncbi:MAG: alpha/beta fold hydrolase [Planktomarina sp.]
MNPLPLVMLPGMMCDARLFAPQIDSLSRDRAVMVAPIHLGERVEDVASSILDMTPHRFALAGLSMGGIVALEIIRRAPDRVARLALIDTNALAETPEKAAAREPQIVGVKAGRMRDIMRDEMKPNYLANGPYKNEILSMVMDMAETLGPEAFIRQSRALQRRRDQQSTLRKIKCPTLVMCGAEDTLCPPKRHEFMAEMIEGAVLHIVAGAGHLPTLEQPQTTNAILRQWLA